MITPQTEARRQLRRRLLDWRNSLLPAERREMSKRIAATLIELPIFHRIHLLFSYCSYQSEVETSPLIRSCLGTGKQVAVPRAVPQQSRLEVVLITDPETELVPGYRGIPEPRVSLAAERLLAPEILEAVIVPGAVFDRTGHRLGYGGGFYDRFLGCEAPRALRIGLAFSGQVIERLPALCHDMPMDMVITENEVLTWSRSADANDCRL